MIKSYIQAARLRTLPLSVSGIIVAGFLAAYGGYFEWGIFWLSLATTIAFQILSNFANDYGDGVKGTDNENRIGPERAIQSGAISPKQMKRAIKLTALISLSLAILLIYLSFDSEQFWYGLLFLGLGIASIWAAIKYTVGESAYGYKGLGDVFVFLFFGGLSVLGGYFLYDQHFIWIYCLPAISIGLLSTAVLNLNNMRDFNSDKESEKNTIVVKLGIKKAKIYHSLLILIPLVCSLSFTLKLNLNSAINYLYLIAFVPLLIHLVKVWRIQDLKALDPELKKVALSTFLYAILFGLAILG